MALVPAFRPRTESELMVAVATLQAHDIHHFVQGQYFGSLYPSLQIESFNARIILVEQEQLADARELLEGLSGPRQALDDAAEPVQPIGPIHHSGGLWNRTRTVLEALLPGWFGPSVRGRGSGAR